MDRHKIMENKIRNFCVFLLLATAWNAAHPTTKILISRYKNWKNPVLNVFNKYELSLYKIRFSDNGKCPTFYLEFKHSPVPGAQNIVNYQNVYFEILKANFDYPYALVDKTDNLKINVGWYNESKTIMGFNLAKASSKSLCADVSPDDSSYDMTVDLKEEKQYCKKMESSD